MARPAVAALHVSPDTNVVAFSVVLCLATTIIFGLLPAWLATRTDPVSSLRDNLPGGGRAGRALLRRALVMCRSLFRLQSFLRRALWHRAFGRPRTIILGST